MTFNRTIEEIDKSDIDSLIASGIPETRALDYKASLPGNSDSDKKEFLADISSFANTGGGHILYGVSEEQGVPIEATGVGEIDVDAEILRLDQILLAGIEPRIPILQIRSIAGFTSGPVIVVEIGNSWVSPHMVAFKKSSRFYARSNAGKYQMDIGQIRTAFALGQELPEKVRNFRIDRLAKIVGNEGPIYLEDCPKIVLHVVPLAAFSLDFNIDLSGILAHSATLQPIERASTHHRYNLDGHVRYSVLYPDETGSRGYCQIFRNGIVEVVDAEMINENTGKKRIPSEHFERRLVECMEGYLGTLRDLNVPAPFIVMLSLAGVKGYEMWTDLRHTAGMRSTPIDREMVVVPDVLIDKYECNIPRIMRAVFDAVWNSAGFPGSTNYDDEGRWKWEKP